MRLLGNEIKLAKTLEMMMNHPSNDLSALSEKTNNLRAIFEILSYLLVDARQDGHIELADRLEFTMNFVENKLAETTQAQTVPPVSVNG
ncbi:MAG: hypothetical protein ABJN43_13180 [Sneathiella sp.]